MSRKKSSARKKTSHKQPDLRRWLPFAGAGVVLLVLAGFTRFESYESLYDAEYVGSEKCGECHTLTYARWQDSPHAKMLREPSAETVVGDFDVGSWTPPPEARVPAEDDEPVARMYIEGGTYFMALRDPGSGAFVPFEIAYVVGYQYRQEYLVQEAGGVLRRLPLQWSTARNEYFPYWNFQEGSLPTVEDLWAQMEVPNSAWNLFCARCHTTHLVINAQDAAHTVADVEWTDNGIACEACHGPGSQHVNYFAHNYVNRIAAAVNSRLRGEPVAYVANPPRLTRGQDLSTCARCHGADIYIGMQDIYRMYEPGYSREGRVNDISQFFTAAPLEPGRTVPTVEVWLDGTPKGIGMLFRSFIESDHYLGSEMACYDCHDAHNNKLETQPGILSAGEVSDGYCLACHTELAGQVAEHTFHEPGTEGARCYDCHAGRRILNIATGVEKYVRTHDFSSVPDPASTVVHGVDGAPNACGECHAEEGAAWAVEVMEGWWGP